MVSTEEEIKVKVFRKERLNVSMEEDAQVKVSRKEAVEFKEEVIVASEFAVPRLEAFQRES